MIKSLLRQDILFYDRGDADKLNASIDDKFQRLISGVQDHAGKLFFSVGAVLGGILVSALISPTFTLGLLLSVMTLISLERLLSACLFQTVGEGVRLEQQMMELLQEIFSAIRLIVSSNEEVSMYQRFVKL